MKTSSSPSWVAAVGQCYDVTLLEASLAAVALIHRLHLVSAGASSNTPELHLPRSGRRLVELTVYVVWPSVGSQGALLHRPVLGPTG